MVERNLKKLMVDTILKHGDRPEDCRCEYFPAQPLEGVMNEAQGCSADELPDREEFTTLGCSSDMFSYDAKQADGGWSIVVEPLLAAKTLKEHCSTCGEVLCETGWNEPGSSTTTGSVYPSPRYLFDDGKDYLLCPHCGARNRLVRERHGGRLQLVVSHVKGE